MKLFLISQTKNSDWDTYDSAVVATIDIESARRIKPGGEFSVDTWCDFEYVTVRYLGEAADDIAHGVVCASFNAG